MVSLGPHKLRIGRVTLRSGQIAISSGYQHHILITGITEPMAKQLARDFPKFEFLVTRHDTLVNTFGEVFGVLEVDDPEVAMRELVSHMVTWSFQPTFDDLLIRCGL